MRTPMNGRFVVVESAIDSLRGRDLLLAFEKKQRGKRGRCSRMGFSGIFVGGVMRMDKTSR